MGSQGTLVVDGTTITFDGSCQNMEDLTGRATWFGEGSAPDGQALELNLSFTFPVEGVEPTGTITVIGDDPALADGTWLITDGSTMAALEDDTLVVEGPASGGTFHAGTTARASVPCRRLTDRTCRGHVRDR